MTPRIKEQILRFNIPMRDALAMQILHAHKQLLETALDLARAHLPLLDRGIQVAAGAVLHDFAPVVLLVLHEVDGLDDVHVVQCAGDAEFCGELFDVFLFGLVFTAFAELLWWWGIEWASAR